MCGRTPQRPPHDLPTLAPQDCVGSGFLKTGRDGTWFSTGRHPRLA
ncbi:MAG: hypothetical protein ACLUVY_05555 [Bacteroides uniformis]